MKTKTYLIILIATIAASCTSLQQSTVYDDIYYSPKDELAVDNKLKADNSQSNKSTIFGNNYDKQISDILEDKSAEDIDTTIFVGDEDPNSYENIIVDDYSEAMDRRMEARNSPYYGTTNYLITTTNAYWAAMMFANDPYYNVIIIGDQVWVEPRYITSSFGYWPNRSYYSYYYDPFYFGYSPYYSYYSPYYYNYYSHHYYHPYYDPYYYYNPYKTYYSVKNDNYASSSFHSYRQRTLSTNSATRSSTQRTSRALPETYAGRDISRSSTVKSGLDRQSVSTERNPRTTTTRTRSDDVATPRIVTESSRTRTSTSATNRNYTRPQSTSRSTYNATTRSTSRYSRPASTNENSNRGQSTSRSTYTPNKNATSSSRSGSTYRSSRSSSNSSSGSSNSFSGSSSRSSVRSSSSSSSSGRSSGSSGSSGRSSGSSSRSGGGRR